MQADILLKRLQTVEFLRGLDHESLEALARSAVWHVFAPGAVVFWEGDTETRLYYLQYGLLKVLRSSGDGREQVLRLIHPGEIFNEVGALAKKPNPATAIALEETGIWLLPRQALQEVILAHPQAAMQMIENMADKIIELAALASDLSLKTVEARFAQLLLEQADQDLIERGRWATHSELAARLGTVPDVLRRITRELTKAGLVQVDRQHIRILDRKGLAERAMLDEKSNM